MRRRVLGGGRRWTVARASCRAMAIGLALLVVLCHASARLPAAPPADWQRGMVDVVPLGQRARRAGLRVIEGERLVLATDRPVRSGDGVDDLPRLFDEAFSSWCNHYAIDPTAVPQWRAFGCLMADRERFLSLGLLPADGSIPNFANGFCAGNRFWMVDPPNPAYRRHLLFHEGVHALCLTLRSLDGPTWYTEGIAELLATHRLEEGRFVPTPIPARSDDVEQLGRIESIRRLRDSGLVPGLAEVFATPPSPRHDLAAYATSWAVVAMLSAHPAHAAAFRTLEAGALDAALTGRLETLPGFDATRAARDFDAFTADVDYGYDFTRSSIDWKPGRPLVTPKRVVVQADRGWQPSGWALRQGERAALSASGRSRIGRIGEIELESGADGISLAWYRGRPQGRLLVAQWVAAADGAGRPGFAVLGEGAACSFVAASSGMVYLKINEPPGELADNGGGLDVEIRPTPADGPR